MYVEDKQLQPPSNMNAKIWRFLDFPKFMSMLTMPSLHFTRTDQFEDPYEGTFGITPPGTDSTPWFGLPVSEVGTGGGQICRGPEEDEAPFVEVVSNLRKRTFVNCWHLNEHEPASMWPQYVRQGVGVAIVSSVKRLVDALAESDYEIRISEIVYVDYGSDPPSSDYPLARFTYKRKSYEHEKELRSILDHDPEIGWRELNSVTVPVDLRTLLTEIRISPGAPLWFGNLVLQLCSRFGLELPTRRSTLDDHPLY